MSSLKSINMTFTTHLNGYVPPPPSIIAAQKAKQSAIAQRTIESYIYKSPSVKDVTALTSVKQTLASIFNNIQVKRGCRSCGGFK